MTLPNMKVTLEKKTNKQRGEMKGRKSVNRSVKDSQRGFKEEAEAPEWN